MGRRKNKYQSLDSIQSDSDYIMSETDELGLSQILAELDGERRSRMAADIKEEGLIQVIKDAVAAVNYNDTNTGAFLRAGVPESSIDKEIGLTRGNDAAGVPLYGRFLNTGLKRATPAPYVSPEGRRVHTEYVKNPVTGVPQIVPMMDTDRPGEALVAPYGELRKNSTESSEAAQKHLMKLMGIDPKQYASVNGNPDGYADFQATLGGQVRNIDGMVRGVDGSFANTVRIPAFMNIRPGNNGQRQYYSGKQNQDLINRVDDIVARQVRDERMSIPEAVDHLVNSGDLVAPGQDQRIGKLLRNDVNRVGSREAQYDGLMLTGYSRKDRVLRDKWNPLSEKEQRTVVAPKTAHLIDLEVANRIENVIKGDDTRMKTMSNSGGNNPFGGEAYNAKLQTQFNINDRYKGRPLAVDVFSRPEFANVHQGVQHLRYM